MRWLFGWRLKSQSWGFWWRLESVWVICCLFLQIRSVRPPPIVHPMTTAMLCVNGSSVLWLPSESGQLAASQTDLREEGQRSHCCGCLLHPPERLAKGHSMCYSIGSAYHSVLLGSETLHLPHLWNSPSSSSLQEMEGWEFYHFSTGGFSLTHSFVSAEHLCWRRLYLQVSNLTVENGLWVLLLWTELSAEGGKTKEEVTQKMVGLWGWRPFAHQSGSADPPECSRATTVSDLVLWPPTVFM